MPLHGLLWSQSHGWNCDTSVMVRHDKEWQLLIFCENHAHWENTRCCVAIAAETVCVWRTLISFDWSSVTSALQRLAYHFVRYGKFLLGVSFVDTSRIEQYRAIVCESHMLNLTAQSVFRNSKNNGYMNFQILSDALHDLWGGARYTDVEPHGFNCTVKMQFSSSLLPFFWRRPNIFSVITWKLMLGFKQPKVEQWVENPLMNWLCWSLGHSELKVIRSWDLDTDTSRQL